MLNEASPPRSLSAIVSRTLRHFMYISYTLQSNRSRTKNADKYINRQTDRLQASYRLSLDAQQTDRVSASPRRSLARQMAWTLVSLWEG